MKEKSLSIWLISIAAKVVLPLITLVLLVLLTSKVVIGEAIGDINNVTDLWEVILCFCLPLFISLALIPSLYELLCQKATADEIGLVFQPTRPNLLFLAINIVVAIVSVVLLYKLNTGDELCIIISFVFVAFCEELMMRGIIMHSLKERMQWFPAAVISSLLFAFVYHSGDDFLVNIIWRFPLGFVLALVAEKTRNVYQSALMHFSINMLVNTVWFI